MECSPSTNSLAWAIPASGLRHLGKRYICNECPCPTPSYGAHAFAYPIHYKYLSPRRRVVPPLAPHSLPLPLPAMGFPAVYAHPFKFGESSSAPYAFVSHFPRPDAYPSALPPPPSVPTHRWPAHSSSTRNAGPQLITPLAAVNGAARSHPLLLQPSTSSHHQSRSHNRTLPNLADPGMSCFATSPRSQPRLTHGPSLQ